MDIGKAFTFPFDDDEWLTKLLLGSVVNSVPILNFAWTGYSVDILKNVTEGDPQPMPDWSDFGDKFIKGFFIWAAGFIYSLPALLIACLPLGLLIIPASSEISTDTVSQPDVWLSVFTGVGLIFLCLLLLYALALSFYFPAVYINFARKGTFGSCFEIGEIIKIVSQNTGKYLTAWLVSIVGAIVIGIVISIVAAVLSFVICIGWLLTWILSALTTVYLFAIYSHLFGQVVAEPTNELIPSD